MTEIKKRGGKRPGSGRPRIGYRQFFKARLEEDLHEWLDIEKQRHASWNLFFRELKKRYEKT